MPGTAPFLNATTTFIQTVYSVPLAWGILVSVFAICAFDSYRSGGARVSAAAIAVLISVFIADLAPQTFGIGEVLKAFQLDHYPAITIGILSVGLFFIAAHMIEPTVGARGFFAAFFGGTAAVVLFLALWTSAPALTALLRFDPLIEGAFTDLFRLYWIIGGFVLLALVRR